MLDSGDVLQASVPIDETALGACGAVVLLPMNDSSHPSFRGACVSHP